MVDDHFFVDHIGIRIECQHLLRKKNKLIAFLVSGNSRKKLMMIKRKI